MRIFGSPSGRGTDIPSVEVAVNAFGKCLEGRKSVLGDVRELPFDKETIKLALVKAIKVTDDAAMKEQLSSGLVALADFQDMRLCQKYELRPEEMMLCEGKSFLSLARAL
jgi:hypothetical protein